MTSKINIGIVGTGSIAHTYKNCISGIEDAELNALYTKTPERVAEAEKEFGVPVFSKMDAFLEQDLDLVCVCNESGRHGGAITAAALAGKHVLCEKPLEITPKRIDEVIAVCEAQKVKLGCTLQNRCSPDYRKVVEAVRAGKLGKLLMGNAHINWYRPSSYYRDSDWKGTISLDGGAAFINQGIHTIDLLLHLMGPVRSVFGKVDTLVHDIEGEDVGAALLNFGNGALGSITAGTALYPGYPERIEIYGEKGSVVMEGGKIKVWNTKDAEGLDAHEHEESDKTASENLLEAVSTVSSDESGKSDDSQATNKNGGSGASDPTAIGHANHKKVIADMIEAIRDDRPPMVDGAEARKSVALITAIYESSKQGKTIFL